MGLNQAQRQLAQALLYALSNYLQQRTDPETWEIVQALRFLEYDTDTMAGLRAWPAGPLGRFPKWVIQADFVDSVRAAAELLPRELWPAGLADVFDVDDPERLNVWQQIGRVIERAFART
jgi:hypothetical protein